MTQTDSGPAVARLVAGAELPAPGRWQIDPGHTELAFIGRHFMLTKVRGRFTGLSGVIEVAERPGGQHGGGHRRHGVGGVGDQARDDHLSLADFLDVANRPTAAFTGRVPDWQAVPAGAKVIVAGPGCRRLRRCHVDGDRHRALAGPRPPRSPGQAVNRPRTLVA